MVAVARFVGSDRLIEGFNYDLLSHETRQQLYLLSRTVL